MTYIPREGKSSEWQMRELRRISDEINRHPTIPLPTSAWTIDASSGADIEAGTGCLLFDPAADEYVSTTICVPYELVNPTIKFWWAGTNTNTNLPVFGIRYFVNDGTITSSPSFTSGYVANDNAAGDGVVIAEAHRLSVKIRPNTIFILSFFREGTSLGDTYTGDAKLIHAEIS